MIEGRLSWLAGATGLVLRGEDALFRGVSIDTRTLQPGQLFVAVRGQRFDGHAFVDAARAAGAAAVVVERPTGSSAPELVATDSARALATIAALWRAAMPAEVVAVTGSNGKTTVKQMLAAILEGMGPTLATHGNLNNEYGVPLTLCRLDRTIRYAVIEMGAAKRGDIAFLADLARPVVGVVTNARAAHLDGFGDIDGVALGKGELFPALPLDGTAVVNADDVRQSVWRELAGGRRVIDFGVQQPARVTGHRSASCAPCSIQVDGKTITVDLPVPGLHGLANALAATAAALALGVPLPCIAAGLERFVPPEGRLGRRQAACGATVLDDTYNANPASLQAAVEVLTGMPGQPWVALGAMAELGQDAALLHREAGALLRQLGVRRLYVLGPQRRDVLSGFGQRGGRAFDCLDDLTAALEQDLTAGVNLLVKGSRLARMERVVRHLVGAEHAGVGSC